MEIKQYTNQYRHQVVDCPFCKDFGRVHWVYVRDVTGANPDPLRDLKRHITNEAKNEAFTLALSGTDPKSVITPHLDYFREHTVQKTMPVKNKRQYDADIVLK